MSSVNRPLSEDFDGLSIAENIVNALPDPVIVLDPDKNILALNPSAEQFFRAGLNYLRGKPIDKVISATSPVMALINKVFDGAAIMREYDVDMGTPHIGFQTVDVQVSPMAEPRGCVLLTMQERTIAQKMDQQLAHRSAARMVTGMAAILAHEIKNPLSGIRGSAQLLELAASDEDRKLTQLIQTEVDRIKGVVEEMEAFSAQRPMDQDLHCNIHEVLEHVKQLAGHGFGKSVRIKELYDPSLPLVHGNQDQLIQVFLNLIKNACEAVPPVGGEVLVTTAYRHGVRLQLPGSGERVHLPLEVAIRDNGEGIHDDIRDHLFDPFVTTKRTGTGLGLALVAKIINDHGGVIEFDSQPGRTIFRVRLPIWDANQQNKTN